MEVVEVAPLGADQDADAVVGAGQHEGQPPGAHPRKPAAAQPVAEHNRVEPPIGRSLRVGALDLREGFRKAAAQLVGRVVQALREPVKLHGVRAFFGRGRKLPADHLAGDRRQARHPMPP